MLCIYRITEDNVSQLSLESSGGGLKSPIAQATLQTHEVRILGKGVGGVQASALFEGDSSI